jgi:hypothetical protein
MPNDQTSFFGSIAVVARQVIGAALRARPAELALVRNLARLARDGEAKVGELGGEVGVEQHVGGPEVAVLDAVLVQIGDAEADAVENLQACV